MSVKSQTIAEAIWPASNSQAWGRFGALAFGGALLLAASAKLQIPFYPVPMTLQTLAVLALGAAFGLRLATATVALYLVEGLFGLPVFAGAVAGPAYMFGPTGGYLVGFLVAAALVGWLADRGAARSAARLAVVMSLGHVAIFACGFAWLALALGADKAFAAGVAPFYAATALKTALGVAVVVAANRSLRRKPE